MVLITILSFLLFPQLFAHGKDFAGCHRHLPEEGLWIETAPYWKIEGCNNATEFTKSALETCLKHRDVYFLGPSTIRQFAYHTGALLGGNQVDRVEQKKHCDVFSIEYSVSSGCKQEFPFTKIHHLPLLFYDGTDYLSRGGFPFVLDQYNKTGTYLFSSPASPNIISGRTTGSASESVGNATTSDVSTTNATTTEHSRKLEESSALRQSHPPQSRGHDLHRQSIPPTAKHAALEHQQQQQQQQQQQGVFDITSKYMSAISKRIAARSQSPTAPTIDAEVQQQPSAVTTNPTMVRTGITGETSVKNYTTPHISVKLKAKDIAAFVANPINHRAVINNPRFITNLELIDGCETQRLEPLECMKQYFRDSKPDDVLVFSAGLNYAIYNESTTVNMEAWFNASAVEFAKNLQVTFKGKNIYRVTLAPLRGFMARHSKYTQRYNDILAELWSTDKPEFSHWKTIDQWAINNDEKRIARYYNDHVHFAGPLDMAAVYQIYSDLCPQQ